jgi:hypothetical protein
VIAPAGALRSAWVLALVLALAPPSDTAAAAGGLAATRVLVAKLAAGRGEAAIVVARADPMGGPDRVERGRITLEPPDRVRLDFAAGGERITLRGDGGEWIQPGARQMVRLDAAQAGMAGWLWEVLLQGGTTDFAERTVGARRMVLQPRDRDSGLPDSITVALDPRGLPAQVAFADPGGGETRYRFQGWSFSRARGAGAFRLSAPRGYTVVDLP